MTQPSEQPDSVAIRLATPVDHQDWLALWRGYQGFYKVDIDDNRNIDLDMTLTAPGCPVAGEMPGWVENAVSLVPGVGNVTVNMVFDPPWDQSRMSDEARVALDWY